MKDDELDKAFQEAKGMAPESSLKAEEVEKKASSISKKPKPGFWVGCGSAAGLLAAGIIVAVSLNVTHPSASPAPLSSNPSTDNPSSLPSQREETPSPLHPLAVPANESIASTYSQRTLSQKTYDSYLAFARNFSSLMLEDVDAANSYAISIPDGYLSLALAAYTSSKETSQEWLSFFDLSSKEELLTAAREVRRCFCVLDQDSSGNLSGGYDVNALWLDPEQTVLSFQASSIAQSVADGFDAALYQVPLTKDNLSADLSSRGLSGFPLPNLDFLPDDPPAASSTSAFYCLDPFADSSSFYETQYKGKSPYIRYALGELTKNVDYLEFLKSGNVYEGEGFSGVGLYLERLRCSFFLPDDSSSSPSSILPAYLAGSCQKKVHLDSDNRETPDYRVDLKAPYFKIDTQLNPSFTSLQEKFPLSSVSGAFEDLATGKQGPLFLTQITQSSTVSLDYRGFYSASVTVAMADAGTDNPEEEEVYPFTLDRPFAFALSFPGVKVAGDWPDVPAVLGCVVDPNYPAYQG